MSALCECRGQNCYCASGQTGKKQSHAAVDGGLFRRTDVESLANGAGFITLWLWEAGPGPLSDPKVQGDGVQSCSAFAGDCNLRQPPFSGVGVGSQHGSLVVNNSGDPNHPGRAGTTVLSTASMDAQGQHLWHQQQNNQQTMTQADQQPADDGTDEPATNRRWLKQTKVPLPSPAPDLPCGGGSGGGDDFGAASFRIDSGGRTNSSDLRKSVLGLNGQQGYEIMLSDVDASMKTVTISDGPVDGECWGGGGGDGGASIRMDSGARTNSSGMRNSMLGLDGRPGCFDEDCDHLRWAC
eukprot:gene31438-6616_t